VSLLISAALKRFTTALAAAAGSGAVGFEPSQNYATQTIGWSQRQGAINVAWFVGADKTGVADNTAIFTAAALLGQAVYAPKGIWAINWTPGRKIHLYGDGAADTVIRPFNAATAAVTLTATGPFWQYSTLFEGICFKGVAKVGIGVAFGASDPAAFVPGMEYVSAVVFRACRFEALEKGVFRPFGNIGVEFYACNFTGNYYGTYSLNNKTGAGDNMHAGNIYFYGGECNSNTCAHYTHNTEDGYYGPEFRGTIFEQNGINVYTYTTSQFNPTTFDGIGCEANATQATGSGPWVNIDVDTWVGAVKGAVSLPARAFIFDGADSLYEFEGGAQCDIDLRALRSRVIGRGGRWESIAGFGAVNSSVTDDTSEIVLRDPSSQGGLPRNKGIVAIGNVRAGAYTINASNIDANARWWLAPHRNALRGPGNASGASLKCAAASPYTGVFSGSGTVVADGTLYPTCNEFTVPFADTAQFVRLEDSVVTTAVGWYVATSAIKVVSGAPRFYYWDRANNLLAIGAAMPSLGNWYTFAAMGYQAAPGALYLDVGNTNAAAVFRVGPVQIRRFNTRGEAQAFLESMAFIEPELYGSAVYDPPSLADGAGVTTTVAVNGAAPGDSVSIAFTSDVGGLLLHAWVSGANVVSVRFQNETGAPQDIVSGTIRATVRKL
jgi:hypothetical protein